MSFPLQRHESFTQEGQGVSTAVFTADNAGLFVASIQSTFNAGSTITGSITQAGSASASVSLPSLSSAQTHAGCQLMFKLAVNDTLTFSISETDIPANSVKSIFNVIQVGASI